MTRDLRSAGAGADAARRGPQRSWRADSPRRVAFAPALVLGIVALVAACTTARERDDPSSIRGSLRFRSAETEEHFRDSYRSGNLYLDFRPVMVADAIFQDERFRALFLKTMRDRYLLDENNLAKMVRDEQERFDGSFEFLVFLYGGSNVPVRLNAESANWRLLLRDDDGDVLQPISMHELRENSPTYRYIQGYFSGLDRWSQLYIVRFPKLEKAVAGQRLGKRPFELLVTGVEGTITMRWDKPGQFYRSPEGIRLEAPPGGAPPPEDAEGPKGPPQQTGRNAGKDESGCQSSRNFT
jgi:hypothetical protein